MAQPIDIGQLESLPPEIVTPILLQLDVSDISHLCRASKYLASFCRDWNFWAEKAHLEFDFPLDLFDQTFLQDPRQRYQQIQSYQFDLDKSVEWAAAANQVGLVKYLLKLGARLNSVLLGAARGGHLELVRFAIDQGINKVKFLNSAIFRAAKYNHKEIVTYLLTQGAFLNSALYGAAVGGNIDLAQELIKAGASDVYHAIAQAVQYNQIEMVDYLLDQPIGDSNIKMSSALTAAAIDNNVEMLALLINRGVNPDFLSLSLQDAVVYNRIEAVMYLVEHGATHLDRALALAAASNNINLVQYLIDHGATDLNEALVQSAAIGKLPMVQYLIEHGATNITGAIQLANQMHNRPIVAYLESLLHH